MSDSLALIMIEQLAFNSALVAYETGIQKSDIDVTTVFLTRGNHKFKGQEKIDKLEGKDESDDSPSKLSRPTLKPQNEEMMKWKSLEKAIATIWIEMRPSTALENINNKLPKKLSVKQAQAQPECLHLSLDQNARWVIAPLGKENANYYALVEQDADMKLCIGVYVEIDEVYFFAEFRDDDIQSREMCRQKCDNLIRKALEIGDIKSGGMSSSQNYDKKKFTTTREKSLIAEILSLL